MPIVVTEFGIVSGPVRPEHSSNALKPILVTEFGMVNEPVSPEQF